MVNGLGDKGESAQQEENGADGVSTFVSFEEKHRLLVEPWTGVHTENGAVASRLYVLGDGSCSGGSFVRALGDCEGGIYSVAESRRVSVVTAFRTKRVVSAVKRWSESNWSDRVQEDLRSALWEERSDLSGGRKWRSEANVRTLQNEKLLFLDQCATRHLSLGVEFFQVAAVVMQVGVVLLWQDNRAYGIDGRPQCSLHEIGVDTYSRSMIMTRGEGVAAKTQR